MKKSVLIIILAVVVVLGAAAAFVLPKILGGDEEVSTKEYYYPLEDYFVVNVKDGGGMLFKATVVLVCNDEELSEFMTENEYAIRDRLLFLFRSLSAEDIENQNIQDELREEIPVMLNEMLGVDYFTSVLFGDFVMQ